MNKELGKAINARSRLQKIDGKTKKKIDVKKYEIQRDLVVKINCKLKRDFYKSVAPRKVNSDTSFGMWSSLCSLV